MNERRIEVVYCDDIRTEVGNKNSLMGVYQGNLFIDAMPVILPKLCAWVNVVTPRATPFQCLRIRVLLDDVPLLDTGDVIDPDNSLPLPETEDVAPGDEGAPQLLAANFIIALTPFQIERQSALVVVAETEQGELKSRRLRIRLAPPSSDQP